MSEKISIPIGLDASGVSADITKASGQVGKAVTGMTRGISAAMGQSLGPFGELIEKADALKAAFGSITAGSKLLAGGIAIAGVAAVYSVKKAVEAYGEMRKAQDEATASAERLAKVQGQLGNVVSGGIVEGQEDRARKNVQEQIDALKKSNAETVNVSGGMYGLGGRSTSSKLSEEEKAANLKKISELEKIISESNLKDSVAKGEAREGNKLLTRETRQATEQAIFENAVKAMPTTDLPGLRNQREVAGQSLARLATQPLTRSSAEQANRASETAKQLDRLIKALEEKAKAEEEWTNNYLEASEEVKASAEKTSLPNQVPTGYTMPSGYGVGGYTSTGGGGNIYGNTAGMGERVRSLSEDVKKIVENTKPRDSEETFITQ